MDCLSGVVFAKKIINGIGDLRQWIWKLKFDFNFQNPQVI